MQAAPVPSRCVAVHLRPVGPLPPAVYWRRRVVLLAAVVLVLLLLRSCAAGDPEPGQVTSRSAGLATSSPATPSPTAPGPANAGSATGGSATGGSQQVAAVLPAGRPPVPSLPGA